jgi:molybdopterin-guanine dinucleotide biosynthesis protein A
MTINKSQVTAVILAGGKGRRLGGQDKGLIEYQGKLLIQHVLDKITPQVNNVLINANRNQDTYSEFGYPVITDDLNDFQGPLAGFLTAMRACNTEYIVALPCDGPNLSDDLVARLMAGTKGAMDTIVVAHDGKRLQPVHALIPVSLIGSLERFLESGDRKIDRWYAQNNMALADFSDEPEVFFNINTEEQRQQEAHNG